MTGVIFTMIYGKTCKACNETKPMIKDMQNKYAGQVRFRYLHIGDKAVDEFWHRNFGISIETDETMSDEEKEEYLRQGVDKYHALPTFFTSLEERPMIALDLMSGGVFYQSPYKFKQQIKSDIEQMIHKGIMLSNGKMTYQRIYSPKPNEMHRMDYMLEKYQES